MLLQRLEGNNGQRGCVGRLEADLRRLARFAGFKPAARAEAPVVAGPQAGKVILRNGRREIVAARFGKFEKFFPYFLNEYLVHKNPLLIFQSKHAQNIIDQQKDQLQF